MKTKQGIALLLAATMMVSVFQGIPVNAQEVREPEAGIEISNYEISEKVESDWGEGYASTITILNTGNTVLQDWALELSMNNTIESIWNASVENYDSSNYIISNLGYNQDIQPGESVSFGYIANRKSNTDNMSYELLCIPETAISGKSIQDILLEEGVSKAEMDECIKYAREESSKEISTRGAAGAIKSAVKKVVKYLVKHVDVIPSKTVRKAFKKYGNKIISALDTVETWTWYGIARALTAVGIPDSVADAIADFIVTWIL